MVYFSINLAKNGPICEKTCPQKLVTKNCQRGALVTLSLLLRFFLYCGFPQALVHILRIKTQPDSSTIKQTEISWFRDFKRMFLMTMATWHNTSFVPFTWQRNVDKLATLHYILFALLTWYYFPGSKMSTPWMYLLLLLPIVSPRYLWN